MSVQDWFALAVRVVGITIAVHGLGLLLDSLLLRLGYFDLPDTRPAYLLFYGGAEAVAGLYLIRGAPLLVGFAYAGEDEEEDEVGAGDVEEEAGAQEK